VESALPVKNQGAVPMRTDVAFPFFVHVGKRRPAGSPTHGQPAFLPSCPASATGIALGIGSSLPPLLGLSGGGPKRLPPFFFFFSFPFSSPLPFFSALEKDLHRVPLPPPLFFLVKRKRKRSWLFRPLLFPFFPSNLGLPSLWRRSRSSSFVPSLFPFSPLFYRNSGKEHREA